MNMYVYLLLIVLSLDILGCAVADDRTKRDLLDKEKDMFQDIKRRLTKLEKSLESRKCDGKPSQDPKTPTAVPGTTYTRWGRSSCGTNASSIVYAGITGGSYYDHSGGAAEYVCLPKNPEWGLSLEGWQFGGMMFGAEYALHSNAFLHQSHDRYEVPCAVCEVTGRPKKIMIPGRKSCPINWTREYTGYLMSGYYKHAAPSEYICVDSKAKKIGKGTTEYGKLLYMVEAHSGSLPCPPYVHGKSFVLNKRSPSTFACCQL